MSDERPNVAVINCDLLNDEGAPATVLRPMDDDEFAQWKIDQDAVAPEQPKPPLERIADTLAQLPQDRPLTAGDLLAAIQGDQ